MGGDYTKLTFDPRKTYNAVLRQQGRVAVDADHNEAAEVLDRRWRSETYDLLSVEDGGPAGRCVVPRSTPDAFLVTVGGGTFTLGVGRAYVDGIQIENFGDFDGAEQWQEVLAELYGTDPTPYEEQPFMSSHADHPHLPDPPALPAGPGIAYLDVWYREVDWLIDGEIRDQALGGRDHATRMQTVWQVRPLALGDGGDDVRCEDDIPGWDELTAPSAGRLTTATEAPQPGENPCILSPEGGYRGRENRLYRVEIHDVAADGTATWKWSRDNASVKSAVTAIDAVSVDLLDAANNPVATNVHRLTVSSLGRDSVLRFVRGGWIEVLDERIDLDPQRAGVLARVVDIDEAERWITLDRELPAADFDAADPESRLTRVVRWDQTVAIAAETPPPQGSLDVQLGVSEPLEDGIQVTLDLDPAGGRFRVGDYWLFAARTADSSVETLDAAPPRGIHHHYARLAVVIAGEPEDCRLPWPPDHGDCCCTEVVRPGESIQEAIEALPATGGTVCLKEGEHPLPATIAVAGNRVTVRGCGIHTRVAAPAGGIAFNVFGNQVTFERFQLEGDGDRPLIRAFGDDFTVCETGLANRSGLLLQAPSHTGLHFVDNRCQVGLLGGLDLGGVDLKVARNRFTGFADVVSDRGAIHLRPGVERASVLDNQLDRCPGHGITLGGLTAMIFAGSFDIDLDLPFDFPTPQSSPFVRQVLIARNRIIESGGTGITSRFIARETVEDSATSDDGSLPLFGRDRPALLQMPAPVEDLVIIDNQIRDGVRSGPALGPRSDGAPYGGIVLGHIERLDITENQITGNGADQQASDGSPAVPIVGIFTRDVRGHTVAGNLVIDNGLGGPDLPRHSGNEGGIVALETSVVLEPTGVTQPIGPPWRLGEPAAVAIHGNRVESVRGLALELTGDGPMQVADNLFNCLRQTGDPGSGAIVISNTGVSPIFGGWARILGADGLLDATEVDSFLTSEPLARSGAVSFQGNQLRYDQLAAPQGAAVTLTSLDDVAFCDNRIDCRLPGDGLQLLAGSLVFGTTVRSQSNGLSETLRAALLSMLSLGLLQSTGTGNQGTHCILIESFASNGRAEAHNLALCCFNPEFRLLPDGGPLNFPCPPIQSEGNFFNTTDFSFIDNEPEFPPVP